MSQDSSLVEDVRYIRRVLEYTSKAFSEVYTIFFRWCSVIVFMYVAQITLRVLYQDFELYANFYNPHRTIGLIISIVVLCIVSYIYSASKKDTRIQLGSLDTIMLNVWFIGLLILIMNDSTNYIPFAFLFEVSYVFETISQVIFSVCILFLLHIFSFYLTHHQFFKRMAIITVGMGIIAVLLTILMFNIDYSFSIIFNFSLIITFINILSISIYLKRLNTELVLQDAEQ